MTIVFCFKVEWLLNLTLEEVVTSYSGGQHKERIFPHNLKDLKDERTNAYSVFE